MEKLKTYLEGRKNGQFAKQAEMSPAYLSQILNENRTPSLAAACNMDRASNGAVPLNSWPQFEHLKIIPKFSQSNQPQTPPASK